VLPVGAGHLLGRMDGERHVHTALPLVFFTGDGFLSSLSIACVSGLDPLYLYLYLYLQLQLCLCLPLCSESRCELCGLLEAKRQRQRPKQKTKTSQAQRVEPSQRTEATGEFPATKKYSFFKFHYIFYTFHTTSG